MENPFLIGKKIYLRAAQENDAEIISVSENHPDARASLYYAIPTNIEEHIDRIKQRQKDHSTIYFTICKKENNKSIGSTAFFRIDWVGRMAIFYLAIAEKENRNKGFGKETTQLMIDYAFATLNLNRIQLHVSVENLSAISVYENAGFIKEGTLRHAMYFDDHYIDFYVMGILKSDWKKNKNKN
jgi:RimJ/RimL family protein N-acetyltransferase